MLLAISRKLTLQNDVISAAKTKLSSNEVSGWQESFWGIQGVCCNVPMLEKGRGMVQLQSAANYEMLIAALDNVQTTIACGSNTEEQGKKFPSVMSVCCI